MKTHKASAKRFILTRTGKVRHRTAGQDHFNSRESGKVTRNKRRNRSMSTTLHRTIKHAMNG